MTSIPILSQLKLFGQLSPWRWKAFLRLHQHRKRPHLDQLAQNPGLLPPFVQESPIAMRYLHLLSPLDWGRFPERDLETDWGALSVSPCRWLWQRL